MEQLSCEFFFIFVNYYLFIIGITLYFFSIDGKTLSKKEIDTSLLSNFKIFLGILFRPIFLRGSRAKITFLISVLPVGLMKKKFMLILGRKSNNLFLEYFMEDLVPVES